MRARFRGFLAWIVAALMLVLVVLFELAMWLVLLALMIVGLVYQFGARLIRPMRSGKPIQRQCLHCEQQRGFTKRQMKRR